MTIDTNDITEPDVAAPLITDDQLDLCETHRLIDALARRHSALIVAGVFHPRPGMCVTPMSFFPDAISCCALAGLVESAVGQYCGAADRSNREAIRQMRGGK